MYVDHAVWVEVGFFWLGTERRKNGEGTQSGVLTAAPPGK